MRRSSVRSLSPALPLVSTSLRPAQVLTVCAALMLGLPLTAQALRGDTAEALTPVQTLTLTLRQSARSAPQGGFMLEAYAPSADLLPAAFTRSDAEGGVSSSAAPFGPQQSAPASQNAPQNAPDKPSKRILGIVPNYRAVGVGAHLPPQSVKEKFVTASQDTFDYSALALALLVAGYSDATNATPEFKSGGSGGVTFSRYLWHSFVDQSVENYSVEFIVPALTREDTRFYTLGSGGFRKRTVYALTRLVITRSDSGHETVNLSELLGAGLGAGVSNFYYPRGERTAGNTLSKYATNLGIDAASYFIREFDTEISRMISPKHN